MQMKNCSQKVAYGKEKYFQKGQVSGNITCVIIDPISFGNYIVDLLTPKQHMLRNDLDESDWQKTEDLDSCLDLRLYCLWQNNYYYLMLIKYCYFPLQ